MSVDVFRAVLPDQVEIVRTLLWEYAAYLNAALGEEHICLANYESELAALPGNYAEPRGVILVAYVNEQPAGCIALQPLKPKRESEHQELACEMKRLWVRPEFRRRSIGVRLAQELARYAREQGYTAMYLDTVPSAMESANSIYQRLGFQRVERYNTNPILGPNPSVAVEFLRLTL